MHEFFSILGSLFRSLVFYWRCGLNLFGIPFKRDTQSDCQQSEVCGVAEDTTRKLELQSQGHGANPYCTACGHGTLPEESELHPSVADSAGAGFGGGDNPETVEDSGGLLEFEDLMEGVEAESEEDFVIGLATDSYATIKLVDKTSTSFHDADYVFNNQSYKVVKGTADIAQEFE